MGSRLIETSSIIYQRAKNVRDTIGTKNLYEVGYEWVNHSIAPHHLEPSGTRVLVGGKDCKQPYSASIFNISAMSYGSLSKNAVLAMSKGPSWVTSLTTREKGIARIISMAGQI